MKALADIYFYNAIGLAMDLRNGSVSEVRALKHLIASIILGGVGFDVPISVEFRESLTGIGQVSGFVLMFITTGIISYYGVWLAYQANAKGDGEDFFLRFAALTLPIGIQLAVLFLGIGIFLALLVIPLTNYFGQWGVYLIRAGFYVAGVVFAAMFFLRMHKYIAVASGADD